MPSTVRTVSRLWLALAAAIIVIGTLTIALIAVAQSSSSARRSSEVAECVNRVLGERARATEFEQDARYTATTVEVRYLRGQASKKSLIAAEDAYRIAQDRAKAYRAAHPAGRC